MTIPLFTRASDVRSIVLSGCEGQTVLNWLYSGSLPDAVWYVLGTAVHTAIEETILQDLDLDQAIASAMLDKEIMLHAARDVGVIESASKRSKRSLETLDFDIKEMLTNWFRDVHPDSAKRIDVYDDYNWPPRVEHNIRLPDDGKPNSIKGGLFTQVDAIFEGGPESSPVAICDWKSGSTASAKPVQLQVYHFGGRIEGWAPQETERIGWFHHLKAGKIQEVFEPWPRSVVLAQIQATHLRKLGIVETKQVLFEPEWWCSYCNAKGVCPVFGGDSIEIQSKIRNAELLTVPPRENQE